MAKKPKQLDLFSAPLKILTGPIKSVEIFSDKELKKYETKKSTLQTVSKRLQEKNRRTRR